MIADLNPLLRGRGNYLRTANLRAGPVQARPEDLVNRHGPYRLRRTIRYPTAA